ncbi:heme peroxidase [Mycena amicta]|nr:heme peroxidase [Mycena amicta]
MTSIPPLQALSLRADALTHWLHRSLPVAPDGKYDSEYQPNPADDPQNHSFVTNMLAELARFKTAGPLDPPTKVAAALVDALRHPTAVDDRKGAFSMALDVLARVDPKSAPAKTISDGALTLLYTTIPHPPATSLGPEHAYRQADGGGNNILSPDIGRAGTPYARSVQGRTPIAPNALPDAGLVFDTLMRARDLKPHPGGNSSLTFAWATIVTHSLFRTDPRNWNNNDTSSYFDLSPLYGINQDTQNRVRDKAQGRGLLYPDVFSEERLTFLPPAASAILVLFNRNHNYIAEMLLKINERGTWTDPPPKDDDKARAKQDEEIFQIAKLVNCGHFMSFIVGDYVAAFLGVSEGITSPLLNDAFSPMKDVHGAIVSRGEGNQCSVEFNILYRWHALLSEKDREWTKSTFTHIFANTSKPLDQLDLADFRAAFARVTAQIPIDPRLRSFGNLTRSPDDGRFPDADLAKIFQDATAEPAGTFRARGVQKELRVIEILGIEQSRRWGVCTMNEFREFLGLKRFETFEEWNPDPAIANPARQLYGHVNNLELYVGLQCEEIMPLLPGVRLSSGFTMMRAILGDALALIRGDRHFTTDFTPWNLTAWGFQDCQRDLHNGGLGSQLPKLLTRHLPLYYPPNSVFTCYPFFTPAHMKTSLTRQGVVDQYTFTRPIPVPRAHVLNTLTGIKEVLGDEKRFKIVYDPKYLPTDGNSALHALFSSESLAASQSWYRNVVVDKITKHSWKYDGVSGSYVDIVKGVVNPAAVAWAAEMLCGIKPKTVENPGGVYTEDQLYEMFATMYNYTYLSIGDSEHGFSSKWAAGQAHAQISHLISTAVLEIAPSSGPNIIADAFASVAGFLHHQDKKKPFHELVLRLAQTGKRLNEIVDNIIAFTVASCANHAQAAVHVIDFYLDDEREHERRQIDALVHEPAADDRLLGYVREALRLNPQCVGVWRQCVQDAAIPQGDGLLPIHVKAGDRVFGSLKNAYLNPIDFPNPSQVDESRPSSSSSSVHTTHSDLELEQLALVQIVKAVFGLKGLRRADGRTGRLAGITQIIHDTPTKVYLTPYGTTSAWPGSMTLVYDE